MAAKKWLMAGGAMIGLHIFHLMASPMRIPGRIDISPGSLTVAAFGRPAITGLGRVRWNEAFGSFQERQESAVHVA